MTLMYSCICSCNTDCIWWLTDSLRLCLHAHVCAVSEGQYEVKVSFAVFFSISTGYEGIALESKL